VIDAAIARTVTTRTVERGRHTTFSSLVRHRDTNRSLQTCE